MKTLEHWVLRVADSDLTWIGFGWLRPAKHARVGIGYILSSSMLLGLPGIVAGAGLIYLVLGRVEAKVWLSLFVLVTVFELLLHLLFAHYWNRRAERLALEVTAA
ncbi:MAG: hypothetical protein NT154_39650 [Verrucomicrobia bacterium]|nr:hypothetical protein [Verrucomicrobiota bacterium]